MLARDGGEVLQVAAACAGLGAERLQSGSADRAQSEVLDQNRVSRPEPPCSAAGPAHAGAEDKEESL